MKACDNCIFNQTINYKGPLNDHLIFCSKFGCPIDINDINDDSDCRQEKERGKIMKEYTKIETVYNRAEDGSKKLIDGSFRNKAVQFLAGNKWICTEKIDGTNIGVVWDGHRVSFQGRTEKTQIPAHLVNALNDMFCNEQTEELFEQVFGEKNVILFGEGYGAKIQKGDSYLPDRCSFILFDVYMVDSDLWLERDNIRQVAKTFGIDIVPVVLVGTLYEAIDFVKQRPKSLIGTADMEGLVCKPEVDMLDRQGNRIIVKVKVKDFC